MILFYILKDKKPVPVTDAMEAEAFLRSGDRVVRRDDINGIRISTVFLAIDHGFDRGLPVLFETMIFGGEHDDYQGAIHFMGRSRRRARACSGDG